MLFHLIVGIIATAAFIWLYSYVQKTGKTVKGWQWLLTVLGFAYAILVLEVIYGFAAVGEPQAALVMGLVTGIVAVIWGVLMGRLVFSNKAAQG